MAMLQQEKPEDFVIATGRQVSVRNFIELSTAALGWGGLNEGEGADEIGRRTDNGKVVLSADPRYFRLRKSKRYLVTPAEQERNAGPQLTLEEMVNEMIAHDRRGTQGGLFKAARFQSGRSEGVSVPAMSLIKPSDRIFVAGARGMAGSAIVRALKRNGYGDLSMVGNC